jgi:hypothetical protein
VVLIEKEKKCIVSHSKHQTQKPLKSKPEKLAQKNSDISAGKKINH